MCKINKIKYGNLVEICGYPIFGKRHLGTWTMSSLPTD